MTSFTQQNSSPYSKTDTALSSILTLESKGYSGPFALHGARYLSWLRCRLEPNRHYLFVIDDPKGQFFAFYKEQTLSRVFADDIAWQRNHKNTELPHSSWSPVYIKLTVEKLRQADESSHWILNCPLEERTVEKRQIE